MRMSPGPIAILTGITVCALVLMAGCTGEEKSQPSEIRIGYQPSTHQVAFMVAEEKGWWTEALAPYGVETISHYEFPTGAPEMQAMLAGELDAAYVGAAPVISALDKGLRAKIVASVNINGSNIVVSPDIDYRSPEDLKGKTIGTFPPGTIQDTLLRRWLKENGIDPDTDVTILSMGPGDAMSAMAAGKLDAAFLPQPGPTIIEHQGAGVVTVNSGDMSPNHACCVLVVSDDLIQNHPEIVRALIDVHMRATDYVCENIDEAAEIYSSWTGNDPDIIRDSMYRWDGRWVKDPEIIVPSVMEYVGTQYSLGYIGTRLTRDDIFDLNFYRQVTG
ncbi:MAG: ABC transporter substrate-binding protein [Methanoculleaceae archaeon]